MKRMKLKITIVFLAALFVFTLILSAQKYKYPKPKEIEKRWNYLERVINEPQNESSEIRQLGKEFFEWEFFTYAFSTYAFTNLALHDSIYLERAEKNIKTCIERVLGNRIARNFSVIPNKLLIDTIPEFSVLYLGHLNLMLGCYRLISNDTIYDNLNNNISFSLYERYRKKDFPFLDSYPGAIWVPDNAVAMASLKMHNINTHSGLDVICEDWLKYVKENCIDEETGVLCSTVNYVDGKPEEEPRGSMLGWSIMFIYQFDPDFAIELYKNYKKNFSNNYLIFRLFRERAGVKNTDFGDIDSGPIFRGYSIPANEFALANAVLADDKRTARKLMRLIKLGTKTKRKNNEISYKVHFVDFRISPMAEALVLHSLTIRKWEKKHSEKNIYY